MRKKGNALYQRWQTMWMRCTNPWATGYESYGGRGIKVCDRWKKFENFVEDMGQPGPKDSLERINNDGDYEPSNVRWATPAEQAANRRTRKDNTSGVKGVSYNVRSGMWDAYAYVKGAKQQLYWGPDFQAAVEARKAWERGE